MMTASRTYESNNLLRGLRENGAYSDLTIKCGDAEFRVHKCIVCPQSTFLQNACEKQKWKEGDTGIIKLKAAQESNPDFGDDDPRAVELMVNYLYLHDYDPRTAIAPVSVSIGEDSKNEESTDRPAGVEPTVEHRQSQSGVPILGDETKADDDPVDETVQPNGTDDLWGFGNVVKKGKKEKKKTKRLAMWQLEPEPEPEPVPEPVSEDYHLPTDSAVTASTVLRGRSSFLEMHAKVFAIASKYDIRSLEHDARKKFKDQAQRSWEIADLIAAIHVVFNLTPDSEFELRNIVKDTMVGHALTLVQHPDFEHAVASVDGLAYDLFRRKAYTRR